MLDSLSRLHGQVQGMGQKQQKCITWHSTATEGLYDELAQRVALWASYVEDLHPCIRQVEVCPLCRDLGPK